MLSTGWIAPRYRTPKKHAITHVKANRSNNVGNHQNSTRNTQANVQIWWDTINSAPNNCPITTKSTPTTCKIAVNMQITQANTIIVHQNSATHWQTIKISDLVANSIKEK